jgi:hypothetical protein
MTVPLSKQVLSDIAELYGVMEKHLAYDEANCEKIGAMYKLLITGNGKAPLPEIVRNHEEWIEECKEEKKLEGARKFEMRKGVILLAIGQAVTLAVFIADKMIKK